jgi:hypothetical protein
MKNKFWYDVPSSLTWEDWKKWRKDTRAAYPLQYWLRETMPKWFRSHIWWDLRDLYWKVYRFFNPCHKDIRKAIPHHWADITSLIIDVNFAIILSFKKEADESWVDWNGTEEHRKFKNWLDAAADWIQKARPELEKQRDNSYPPHPLPAELKGKSYDELYGEVNRVEKLINDTDTTIIKQMIEYRDYMWT